MPVAKSNYPDTSYNRDFIIADFLPGKIPGNRREFNKAITGCKFRSILVLIAMQFIIMNCRPGTGRQFKLR